MAFSNPFDDPQGSVLHFAQCAGAIQSVAATMRLTGRLGRCVSAAVTERPASSGWKPTGVL